MVRTPSCSCDFMPEEATGPGSMTDLEKNDCKLHGSWDHAALTVDDPGAPIRRSRAQNRDVSRNLCALLKGGAGDAP